MFYKGVFDVSLWCTIAAFVNAQQPCPSDVFVKPAEVLACEQRAQNEPVNQTLAAEACLRTYFVNRVTANPLLPEDFAMLGEFAAKKFGKNPPASGYRIRRDIRVLTVTERQKLFRAFNVLYKTGVLQRFARLSGQQVLRKHRGASFFPWHRVLLAAVEEKLREIDPEVSLAYWDYTADYYLPLPSDSVIWSPCFVGNGDGIVREGPFRFMYGGFNTLISRDIAPNGTCPPRLINKDDVDELMRYCYYANITTGNTKTYYTQPHNLEILQNGVHMWVGGDMSNTPAALYDPVFFLHHVFIDYIWEQFRTRQSSLSCRVDVERDYREPGDYAVDNFPGHAPWEEMHGFEYLQNRDGLWRNWTTAFYGYEPAPKCPDCGNSENLYCDREIDPRRPEGVCVTKTKFFCVDQPPMDVERDKPFQEQLGGGAIVTLGTREEGLPGDGRTRFMSQEEGLAILREQVGHMTASTPSVTLNAKEPDAPGNLKPTLTLNLHEELYVISSSDSQRALGKYEAIVRALFTTTIVILASLI
ncbi:putative tyrosinase-like protein tyr-3 [Dreissena polymorpha]|uniref:putative tyrosinase-like protein tyr-3 n=1 Tax=Dreissena polymorpha TaxID=45954 RepID=UPI002265351D|nr:putative tyrosinase-like protein tyr-3 [Dreissena polymorpha]